MIDDLRESLEDLHESEYVARVHIEWRDSVWSVASRPGASLFVKGVLQGFSQSPASSEAVRSFLNCEPLHTQTVKRHVLERWIGLPGGDAYKGHFPAPVRWPGGNAVFDRWLVKLAVLAPAEAVQDDAITFCVIPHVTPEGYDARVLRAHGAGAWVGAVCEMLNNDIRYWAGELLLNEGETQGPRFPEERHA